MGLSIFNEPFGFVTHSIDVEFMLDSTLDILGQTNIDAENHHHVRMIFRLKRVVFNGFHIYVSVTQGMFCSQQLETGHHDLASGSLGKLSV